jgi:hypothetical protein
MSRYLQVLRLLVGDDDVHVVLATEAVVAYREQTVGVGRQVDAHHAGALVRHHVEEAGVLVREPVVVLPPDQPLTRMSSEETFIRHGSSLHFSSHLACWLTIESMRWTKDS